MRAALPTFDLDAITASIHLACSPARRGPIDRRGRRRDARGHDDVPSSRDDGQVEHRSERVKKR